MSDENSTSESGFIDITAIDSGSDNLPDDSSSSYEGKSLLVKDVDRVKRRRRKRDAESSRRKSRESSSLAEERSLDEEADVLTRESSLRKDSSTGKAELRELSRRSPSPVSTLSPITKSKNPVAQNSDLAAKKQQLLNIKKLLTSKLNSLKNGYLNSEVLTETDQQLIELLIRNKADLPEESSDTSDMVVLDDLDQFSVMPVSSDWPLRHFLLRKFTPFMEIQDLTTKLLETTRELTFDSVFKSFFNFRFQLALDSSTNSLLSFKIIDHNNKQLNGLAKTEFNSLINYYFKYLPLKADILEVTHDTVDTTLLNTVSNAGTTLAIEVTDVSYLKTSDSSYSLQLKADRNISDWFASLNNYCLLVVKRIVQLVLVVDHFYDTAVLSDELKSSIAQSVQLILKNYNLKELLLRLNITSHTSIDEFVIQLFSGKDVNKQKIFVLLIKHFKNFQTVKFGSCFKYSLTISWLIHFEKSHEPLSLFEVAYEPSHSKTPTIYNHLNGILSRAIEERGVYQGVILVVENFLGIA